MEIIGRNIPSFQTAIASVASGIQESTQVKGLAAINSAFETFSAPGFGALSAPESLASVADVAQFSAPDQYFQANSSASANPKFDSREFAAVINDKNFSPLNELSRLGENSLFQRGIIVVGGKVPAGDNIDHFSVPTDPIVPHPQPARLTSTNSEFNAAYGYGPELNGSVKPNEVIQEAMEKGKQPLTQKETEYIYPNRNPLLAGEPPPDGGGLFGLAYEHYMKQREILLKQPYTIAEQNPELPLQIASKVADSEETKAAFKQFKEIPLQTGGTTAINDDNLKPNSSRSNAQLPGVNPETLGKLKDFFKSNAEKSGSVLEGRADQTETIKKASEKAVHPLFDQVSPIPSLKNPLLSVGVQGSAEQNETVQEAMEKGKQPLRHKEPEYIYANGQLPGVNPETFEKLKDFFKSNAEKSGSVLEGRAEQNESVQNAMEKAKHPFTKIEPEYIKPDQQTKGMFSPGGASPGVAVNDFFSHWDNIKASELNGSANQTETIKNATQLADRIQGTADQNETIKKASQSAVGYEGPLSPERLDAMMNAGLHDSAKQNESIANEMEKAKPSYVPKEPEYLQGDLPSANHSQSTSASDADQRGIIIVGGKSQGTYFETIDDTLAKMNQNPQPETVQLYQQQVGALQDLSATVQQSIQMNQQLTSATFISRFRV